MYNETWASLIHLLRLQSMTNDTLIKNCKFVFKCPQRWDYMDIVVDKDKNIRMCFECNEKVYLVDTQDELNRNIELGLCTAIYDPELGQATAGAISIESYAGDSIVYTIYIDPMGKLTTEQVKTIKNLLNLKENLVEIKKKYESSNEVMLSEHEFDNVATSIITGLEKAGINCRMEEYREP